MCKYSDSSGYKCPHENFEDNDYCIFHLQDDNKDVDEFNKGIKEILETEKDSINFHGFYFPPVTSDFSAQNFKTKIDFFNVIFSGKADFYGATFSGEANFSGATFSEEANFNFTTFSEEANFIEAGFSEEADFTSAIFSGGADFSDATYSKEVGFYGATFSGGADFSDATFSGGVDFSEDIFSGDADFSDATFSGGVDFSEDIFSGDAEFSYAIFSGSADFTSATFSGKANFSVATFSEKANFYVATFLGEANFSVATFSGEANFNRAELTGKFVLIPDKSETINFQNTYFSDNVRIKTDMSKCSLANSNIERVDMTDSSWMRDDKSKQEISIKIWEEQQGKLSSNWKELEGIYRRLKQSYQKFGDNSTAGIFYYQEMECKKQQLKGLRKLFWNVFYKALCGYGEKPFNVIIFSGLIILISSLLFFYCGIELIGSEILGVTPKVIDYNFSLDFSGIQWAMNNIHSVLEDFWLCLYTSVITFTTLGYGDVHPIGFSRIVASGEAGFGIIMTALFIFVFTRKMLR